VKLDVRIFRGVRMNIIARQRWPRLEMSTLSILSAIALCKVAGILPTTSSPIAAGLILLFCMVGLRHFYEGLFALVASVVHVKARQLKVRRQAARGA
jgi:hypothetical protein